MKKKPGIPLLFHYCFYLRLLILKIFSTIYCRIVFRLQGVKIGSKSKFFGVPLVYLFPGSEITIGNNIDVRTSRLSNFIGLNRRTIIATHSPEAKIVFGNNCGISGLVIGAKESVIIGDNALIGANVLITDFDWHPIDPATRHTGVAKSKPVVISDNVFIGYSSTILKGVFIGENSVIGANSVVTGNIPANVIAAGNPCKVVSNLR